MLLRLAIATWALALPAFPAIVYQNTALQGVQDVFADVPGLLAIGDQLLLAPGPWQLNSVRTRVTTFDDPVTADLRLTLYAVGAGDTVGSELATRVLPVALAANTSSVVEFNSWALSLPDQLIVMLSLENASSRALGIETTDPPAVGSSDSGSSWWRDGTGFFRQQFPDGLNNYYFEIEAAAAANDVPEPAAYLLAGPLLLVLLLSRARERAVFDR